MQQTRFARAASLSEYAISERLVSGGGGADHSCPKALYPPPANGVPIAHLLTQDMSKRIFHVSGDECENLNSLNSVARTNAAATPVDTGMVAEQKIGRSKHPQRLKPLLICALSTVLYVQPYSAL